MPTLTNIKLIATTCPECHNVGTIEINDFGPDTIACPSCRRERDQFLERHSAACDLDILARILKPYLGAVPVSCTCFGRDGYDCPRCELERIVAQRAG